MDTPKELNTIKELERIQEKLHLIKAYEGIIIKFKGNSGTELSHKTVRDEINKFIQDRIQSIDTEKSEQKLDDEFSLTKDEIHVLKTFVNRLKNKPVSALPIASQLPQNGGVGQEPGTNLITNIIHSVKRKKSKTAIYDGKQVQVMASSGPFSVIKYESGNKEKVSSASLSEIS